MSPVFLWNIVYSSLGLPWWLSGKESTCNAGERGEGVWGDDTPVFLTGKSHGQRSLAGYSPWGLKELDSTEHLKNNEVQFHEAAMRAKGENGGSSMLPSGGELPQCLPSEWLTLPQRAHQITGKTRGLACWSTLRHRNSLVLLLFFSSLWTMSRLSSEKLVPFLLSPLFHQYTGKDPDAG